MFSSKKKSKKKKTITRHGVVLPCKPSPDIHGLARTGRTGLHALQHTHGSRSCRGVAIDNKQYTTTMYYVSVLYPTHQY